VSAQAPDGGDPEGEGPEAEARQAASARLFVAVVPPPEVLDALAALPRPERKGVRYTTGGQWHVTLRFLGTAPIATAVQALGCVTAPPVLAHAGPVTARLGRYVVCLPVDGLLDLARAVVDATAAIGRPPDTRPFRGHVTVARLARAAPRRLEDLVGHPLDARFPVSEIHLMRSVLGPGGSVYDSLAVQRLSPKRPEHGR
jgi:2'-5' RNA ligase